MENKGEVKRPVKCWNCRYCDKESTLINGKWIPTKTGYCLAENSAANGQSFYRKVYIDTTFNECIEYIPRSQSTN